LTEAKPQLLAAVLLEDEPRQRAGEAGTESKQGRARRRAVARREVVEAEQRAALLAPEERHPPAVGEDLRLGHADTAGIAGSEFDLAQERGAG
jgi:hypothetical protein